MPMYSSIKSILVLLFAFVFLTACGGGGGGTTTPTAVVPTITTPSAPIALESDFAPDQSLFKLDIDNASSITSIDLLVADNSPRQVASVAVVGEDSPYFKADLEGNILVRDDVSPIPEGTYPIDAVIKYDPDGQKTVSFEIVVTDIAAPQISDSSFVISEGASSGETGDKLTITNPESAIISSIVLIDTATQLVSTDFSSDNEGNISVLPEASLDFESETKPNPYILTAVASSDGGDSNEAAITISIEDAADTAPTITANDYEVLEGRGAGTVIATLDYESGGSEVDFVLGGADADSFDVDDTGALTLETTAIADTTYSLIATASNSTGESEEATINVVVIPAASWGDQATTTIMAIGDSITAGKGGITEADAQLDIDAAIADRDAKSALVVSVGTADNKTQSASNNLNAAEPNLASAALAIGEAQVAAVGTSVENAIDDAKGAIEEAIAAASADPVDEEVAAEKLASAQSLADSAKIATASALADAQTAEQNANFTIFNLVDGVQRYSYRKELIGALTDELGVGAFNFVGSSSGPGTFADGNIPLFDDSENEGHSGFLIRQLYDVAAEYTCTQDRVNDGECEQEQLGSAITGGPHPDVGNVDSKSYLNYVFEDLKLFPNVALVMLGTNDMAFPLSTSDLVVPTAKADIEDLISVLRKANPKMAIFIAKIPPIDDPLSLGFSTVSVVPFNDAIADIVENDSHATSQLFVVDQHTDFVGTGSEEDPIKASLHVGDGVHPNEAGEAILAENWFNKLNESLSTSVSED